MEVIEITAGTVEQAIEKAEAQLGLSRDQFKVEVIREGRSGILGVGGREAVIRVSSTTLPEEDVVSRVTEILDTLLGLMGVQGKVQVLSDESPLALNIEGDDLGILIGRRGQTVVALEYVTKLIVVQRLKAWLPLTIDVGGYKKHRRDSLQKLALYLAEQVKSRRRAVPMEPMPADERRIIHLALADHPDVTTQSIGERENRKVVILPREG
ncbi:MAG: protein jag [Dehalococcoidia bacterium]|nr:protein jag [Dehalococcoidia bacterium]MDH4291615.1 protein jag [Dehalococcoidia bacterium]